jgi:hypothetical protein
MRELFLILRDILTFKRGPQDLPYAPNLTVAVIVVLMLIQLAVAAYGGRPVTEIVPRLIVSNLLPIGILYLLLHARQLNGRFMQTLLAQALSGIAFLALIVPLLTLIGDIDPKTTQLLKPGQALAALLFLAAALWKLGVEAHILRHSLDVPFFAGVLITILIGVANLIVHAALFGERVGTAGVGV